MPYKYKVIFSHPKFGWFLIIYSLIITLITLSPYVLMSYRPNDYNSLFFVLFLCIFLFWLGVMTIKKNHKILKKSGLSEAFVVIGTFFMSMYILADVNNTHWKTDFNKIQSVSVEAKSVPLETIKNQIEKENASPSLEEKTNEDWEKAKQVNTILAYEEFLKQYPSSKFVYETLLKIGILERDEAFRSIKRVKVAVLESHGDAKGVSLPFKEEAIRLLKHADVQAVNEDSMDYDAIITINAIGEARGAAYLGSPKILYTGAVLEGKVVFEIPEIYRFEKQFKGEVDPSHKIKYRKGERIKEFYETKDHAPFGSAFRESFPLSISILMRKIFGDMALVLSLTDSRPKVSIFDQDEVALDAQRRAHVIVALGDTVSAQTADRVKLLLNNEYVSEKRYLTMAMMKISGYKDWLHWWKY